MFLVRRFSFVCLIAMGFGFGMAALVERTNRPVRPWQAGQVVPCKTGQAIWCPPLAHR